MTQLSKAIKAVDTYTRTYNPQKLSPLFQEVYSGSSTIQTTEFGKVYRIECKIGATVTLSDYAISKDDVAITEAIHRTKRQVIEAVFGEFRPYFRRIEKAIYDQDYTTSARLLHEMEQSMFELE